MNQKNKRRKKNKKATNVFLHFAGRLFTSLGLLIVLIFLLAWTLVFSVAHGPSTTMRNMLVNMAMQASATKWVPRLVMSEAELNSIVEEARRVSAVPIPKDDDHPGVPKVRIDSAGQQYIEPPETTSKPDDPLIPVDEWAEAINGAILKVVNAPHCKAYIALIKDPSRVYVATPDAFVNRGIYFWEVADRDDPLIMINAGEYPDPGYNGRQPMGITYSNGKCVWDDGLKRTFMGFDAQNRLIVQEGMTRAQADSLGIRDAVCFQTNNVLIQKTGNSVSAYRRGDTAVSQRTAIGQRENGTVIMIVTDGRTAASPGASFNDIIDLMLNYGAVNAGMLDGGSSAMMYYREYFNVYKDFDVSTLDTYQKMGLVSVYKAFTKPRAIPTYFAVREAR